MKGDKIFLRILEESDIIRTQKWINSEEISQIMGYLPVLPLVQQLDWYRSSAKDRSKFIFAICDNESKEHIGNVGLGNIDYINRHAMFNIFIAEKKYRAKGIGLEATRLLLDFSFNRLNLNKVFLQTSEKFIEANRMYTNLGFSKDGVLREHYYTKGKYEDKLIYSLLKKEFNG